MILRNEVTGADRTQLRARMKFGQLLSPRFARSLAMIGTAGRIHMNRLQIRVWSGRWSPHSNHCAAGAAMRIPASAGRTTRFRQKSLHRQLVSRAGQSGRTKNGRQSCPTRRERARPSNEPMTRQRAQLQGRVISGWGRLVAPWGVDCNRRRVSGADGRTQSPPGVGHLPTRATYRATLPNK